MMAMGLPTVVTDHPGLTEAAVERETSLIVPIGDAEALARALLALIDDADTRAAFGLAARRRVETEFSLVRYFRDLRETYGDLLEHAPSRSPARGVGPDGGRRGDGPGLTADV